MKKMLTGILWIAFLCTLLSVSCTNIGRADAAQTVRIGWFTTEGGQFIDSQGNHSGYSYEYYQEIAKYAGWNYTYVPGTWDECLSRLQNGEIDVISFAQHTPSRSQLFDFSGQSMGKSYTQLTARNDNALLSQNDFANFDGKTIGILAGVTQKEQLERFAAEHHFQYRVQIFAELDQMLLALQNSEIDMALHHSARCLESYEKVVAKFAPQPFYFIVQRGNRALLEQIDLAMTEIEINNPHFSLRLTEKYYAANAVKSFILTQREKDFLTTLPVLRVVSSPAAPPISATKSGVFTGINADILERVAALTGIHYQFIPTASYEESLAMIRDGHADLICDYYADYSWAEQNHVVITSPFIECQYSMVKRREAMPPQPKVAAVRGLRFSNDYVLANYAPDQITWYDSVQECFDALREGRQDLTFTMTYTAERYLRDYQYGTLTAFAIPYSHYISFATSADAPLMLNTILDKALASLSKDEIQNIIAAHTVFQADQHTLQTFVYRNPIESVAVLAGIILLVSLLSLTIVRAKSRHNQTMRALLYTDEVTDYPNYRKFKVEAAKLLADNTKVRYALLYKDIQKFKYINDTLGHAQGDRILGKVMQQITDSLKEGEFCSRVYADHFAALIHYQSQAELSNRIAIFSALLDGSTKVLQDLEDQVIFRTGVYLLPAGETDIEKAVDLASYAKDSIGYVAENTCVYYDERMRTRIQEEKELEARMHYALANGEFEAYFQPRVDVNNKEIVGAEALVRWNHPDKGFLSPAQFIPFFEQNGFVTKLDLYIFEQVCQRQRQLLDNGKKIVPISSNFSRHHLTRPGLPDTLLTIANHYGIPTNMFEIEITETVATYNFELAVDMANKLKEYGFLIAIDDFGSGYSSIQLLYKLPLDVLKIDKDYTQNDIHNKIETEIITSIVEITHGNGIKVVFEGIENQKQEDLVKNHHCRFGQGYYYAKPIQFSAFQEKLTDLVK